jgi:hypothetical protein
MTTIISIALAHNLVDRLELVATSTREGPRDTVWHAWQSDPDRDEWTDWQPFGRLEPELMVDALQQHDGGMAVAVAGGSSDVRHRHQTGTSTWSDWSSLGSPPVDGFQSSLAFAQNDDDRLEFFVTGEDGRAWHRWRRPPSSPPPWSDWTSMGLPHHGEIRGPLVVTHDTQGRLEAFCVAGTAPGRAAEVWHRWQVKAGSDFSPWTSLKAPPGLLFDVVLGMNGDGRLEVFTVVDNGEVWHRWQQRPGEPESWDRPWHRLGSPGSPPVKANQVAVALNAQALLTLVVTARDGRELWQLTQATPPAVGWGTWTRLPAVPTAPVNSPLLYLNRLGGLGLFLLTPSTGGLYQLTQSTPDGAWTGRRWSSP